MSRPRKERLGRGLGALLGEHLDEADLEAEVRRVPVDAVVPNPHQPRKDFPEAELEELASSIRENGLLQPLVVRPAGGGDRPGPRRYELVAGERRYRAIRSLEWKDVPVVVREVDDETLLVLALVENLQREELNALEEAEGYRTLAEDFGMTQAQIAASVGKNRSTVANMLRLLGLPPSVRKLLRDGALSMGHARALLSLDDDVRAGRLAKNAVDEGWSVREVERRVKARRSSSTPEPGRGGEGGGSAPSDPVVRALEERLREVLATKVRIRGAATGRGRIEIRFHDEEEFERLFALISGDEASRVVG